MSWPYWKSWRRKHEFEQKHGASGGQEHQFDLLVDGELNEKDRRELLSQLDREPDGWRRCALAFLQAQAWQQALGPMVSPDAARAVGPLDTADKAVTRRRSSWPRYLVNVLAMAASFLVALELGMQLRDRGWPSPRAAHAPALESVAKTTTPATLPTMPTSPAAPATSLVSKAQPRIAAPANPWQMVTLTAGGGADGAKQSFELPARKCDKLDESWLSKLPAAVPPEVVEALRQSGHEIREHRELLPVEMQDGSRLVVPVDDVEIINARRRAL